MKKLNLALFQDVELKNSKELLGGRFGNTLVITGTSCGCTKRDPDECDPSTF